MSIYCDFFPEEAQRLLTWWQQAFRLLLPLHGISFGCVLCFFVINKACPYVSATAFRLLYDATLRSALVIIASSRVMSLICRSCRVYPAFQCKVKCSFYDITYHRTIKISACFSGNSTYRTERFLPRISSVFSLINLNTTFLIVFSSMFKTEAVLIWNIHST